jgi:hypothetical protein
MQKPTIFFSHSSRDKAQLLRLKEIFVAKTGGTIDVFLSSDGQSIPLGRNWVHTIEQALEDASMMLVFVTPNALRSNWLFFESGYSHAKKIRVVPIGFLGVDLVTLAPPLSLLQGFNIRSEEGMNNIIALANETFGHHHQSKFSQDEYLLVCGTSSSSTVSALGEYTRLINDIYLKLPSKSSM